MLLRASVCVVCLCMRLYECVWLCMFCMCCMCLYDLFVVHGLYVVHVFCMFVYEFLCVHGFYVFVYVSVCGVYVFVCCCMLT